jgi:hypothetical protein
MLCEYTLLVAIAPCRLVLAGLCFLTFCGRLACRVLVCCSTVVIFYVLIFCLWCCFLVSCWGVVSLFLLILYLTALLRMAPWSFYQCFWQLCHTPGECEIDLTSPSQSWFSFEASFLTRYLAGLNKKITLRPTFLKIYRFSLYPFSQSIIS